MTKHTVHSIAREIVAREGGYVNDPDDPGGPTKYGVTIHTMRRLGMDLDKDGDVDVQDVKILTIDQAVDIFIKHYFYGPRINELPDILHDTVFDMQVNAGAHAVKILQRMCNEIGGTGTRIVVDGFIGPARLRRFARPTAGWVTAFETPTVWSGATTTLPWLTENPPAGSTPATLRVGRAAGSGGQRSSSRRATT